MKPEAICDRPALCGPGFRVVAGPWSPSWALLGSPPFEGKARWPTPFRLPSVKRLSPVIILGALAAFLLLRRRETDVVVPDSAWNPVKPS